jgi:hypothetical protein
MVAEKAPKPQVFSTWKEYSQKLDQFETCDRRRWIYRGEVGREQTNAVAWEPDFPCSTLERSVKASGLPLDRSPIIEERLLREFKRRAHHYLKDPPSPRNTLEWLALMRHYGAPVRLLDCTYSIHIATYFAVGRPSPVGKYVVWAFQANWFTRTSNTALGLNPPTMDHLRQHGDEDHDPEVFADQFLFRNPPLKCLYPVNPFRLNDRLTVQQGLFLCPGDVTSSMEENANALPVGEDNPTQILELSLSNQERIHFLQQLHRMGIDGASLFPGLQGFAEALNTRIGMPWIHDPNDGV